MTGATRAEPRAGVRPDVAGLSRWPDRSVPDVLAEVVAAHGARTAVHTPQRDITYRELAARAGRIEAALRESAEPGAAPRHVALLFDHGVEAVVAMLGVLSAGETYIPLDAGDPIERLELILRDSLTGARGLLLTHGQRRTQAEKLAAGRCPVIDVDALGDLESPPSRGEERVPPDRAAYLIYTSGSTGVPKGVVQTHRNLLHFVGCYAGRLGVTERDRLSLVFTLSFSASNMDIYGALMTGAALCPYDVRGRGAADLARWVVASGITVLHAAPSLLRGMLAVSREPARLESVRVIDLGGDVVQPDDVRLWRDRFRLDSVLVNHLAATESSVIAMHAVPREAADERAAVPAGTPPPGVAVRIVAPDGSECAPGVEGEIHVSSPFVSPGYWNRPELNAAAFAQDPSREGWRVYRSGDIGRVDRDGLLRRLGRKDDRVKIRGHSVDLAEVEAALSGATGSGESVVVAVAGSRDGEFELAAYAERSGPTAEEIRRAMAARLPSYMVPSEIHLLERLPHAATGKVDRRLLSGPDRPRTKRGRDLTPPEGQAERKVAAVFGRILGLDAVGRDEGFFDLGGSSITAAELQVGLRAALGIELTPASLLKDSTVRGIAALALRAASAGDGSAPILLPLRATGSRAPLFLVHGLLLQAFMSPIFVNAMGDDQPIYAFQGRVGKRAHARFGPLVDEYLAALRAIRPKGPYFLGGLCVGGYVALEMACRLRDAGEAVAPLLLIDPTPPRELRGLRRLKHLVELYAERLYTRLGRSTAALEFARARMDKRVSSGTYRASAVHPKDVAYAMLSLRIARELHRPRAYGGAVRILGSVVRNEETGAEAWRRLFPGDLRLTIVGDTHTAAINPASETFMAAVREVQDEVARM